MKSAGISLGIFRQEISGMKGLRFTGNNPLEPISISMPVDSVHVSLPYNIYLASGSVRVCLSHIQTIKRFDKDSRKSYLITCGDYKASDTTVPVKYRLWYEESDEEKNETA